MKTIDEKPPLVRVPLDTDVTTASGRVVSLLDPQVSEISFFDILEALPRLCRFAGQIVRADDVLWSVAAHTMMGAELAGGELLAYWLLHDAHEAYLSDLPKPVLKAVSALVGWDVIGLLKSNLDQVIYEKAGLAWPVPEVLLRQVKEIDLAMLRLEERCLRPREAWVLSDPGLDELSLRCLKGWEDQARPLRAAFAQMGWVDAGGGVPAPYERKLLEGVRVRPEWEVR